MQISLWITFSLLCLAIIGCQRPGAGLPDQPESVEDPADPQAAVDSAEGTAAAVAALNQFALRLHEFVAEPGRNTFFSPVSIYSALAMTAVGAEDETAREMEAVLLGSQAGSSGKGSRLSDSERLLAESLRGAAQNGGVTLEMANALWVQQGFRLKDSYVSLLDHQFGAASRALDFLHDLGQSREEINRWTAEKTSGRIDPLLPEGSLNQNTRLVLTNAIYFLGAWQDPFDERATRSGEFHRDDRETVEAPFMNRTGAYRVAQTGDGTWLELPYRGDRLGMVVGLPARGTTLALFSAGLSSEDLSLALAELRVQRIDLAIPKFKFEKKARLADPLKQMGISRAFEPGAAEFGGISNEEDLFIQEIFHGAFVEVNERGTEAAAATGISVGVTSMPPEIRLDRPFLFLIRDMETGAILFLGQLADPTP